MKWRSHRTTIAGLLLLGISAYPLALMAREWGAARRLASTFTIKPEYGKTSIEFNGHRIEISDAYQKGTFKPEDRRTGPVTIKVDGADHSDNSLVEIRPHFHDANRYHGWLMLGRLISKDTSREWMTVGQRTLGETLATGQRPASGAEFRILRVDEKGAVAEERFDLAQRTKPLYRAIYARFLTPHPIGFYLETIRYPTVLSPVLYPCASGAIGFLLVAVGLFRRQFGV